MTSSLFLAEVADKLASPWLMLFLGIGIAVPSVGLAIVPQRLLRWLAIAAIPLIVLLNAAFIDEHTAGPYGEAVLQEVGLRYVVVSLLAFNLPFAMGAIIVIYCYARARRHGAFIQSPP